MLLSGEQLKAIKLIEDGKPKQYRAAGYDVVIEKIIDHRGIDIAEDFFALPPNGIVEVISAETIKLPSDVCGFASIKTGLCDQGVLALNIGIVDPGWQGRVSTTLINFGNQKRILSKGDTFLRLTFHKFDQPAQVPIVAIPDDQYIRDKQKKAKSYFNENFIDVSYASRAAFGQYRRWLLAWVPIAITMLAILLAFTTYYATFLANNNSINLTRDYWIPTAQQTRDNLKTELGEISNLRSRVTDLEGSVVVKSTADDLQRQISRLESEIAKLKKP